MSTNCIRCIHNPRTGIDLLCDACRSAIGQATPPKIKATKIEPTDWSRRQEPEPKPAKGVWR